MPDSRIIARCVLMLGGTLVATAAMAQDAFTSAAAAAADEKAQKQADRTMYWIRVLAQSAAPRPAPPPKAPAASAPAPSRTTAAPERVKPPAATLTAVPPSAAVVHAAPAAVEPSLAAATATDSGGAGAAPIEAPPVEEEPDPGLIMIKSADPEFPIATMRRLRKGEVAVRFEVSADGSVGAVTVMKTSHPGLNAAAMDAVRQWRFKPTPRAHTALVELAFNLDT